MDADELRRNLAVLRATDDAERRGDARAALDLMDEGLVDLDEAVRRIPPSSLVRIRDPRLDPDAERTLLGAGLPASPGAAVGKAVFSAARAEELAEATPFKQREED